MGCFELKKGWIVFSIKLYRVLKIEPYHRLLRGEGRTQGLEFRFRGFGDRGFKRLAGWMKSVSGL